MFCLNNILATLLLAPVLTGIYVHFILKLATWRRKTLIQELIKEGPKTYPFDKVILHGLPRTFNCPNASPFVLKLETYLKAAKIPYEFDSYEAYSPIFRKTPWVSYKGRDMGDSSLIIQFLNKEFNVDLNGSYSKADQGAGRAFKTMLEEHYFWALSRWTWNEAIDFIDERMYRPTLWNKLTFLWTYQTAQKLTMWLGGLGLLKKDDFHRVMCDDLRALDDFIGKKKFFLGEELSEIDCTIFAFTAISIHRLQGSPYQKLIKEELGNLRGYYERVKARVWPDWEEIIKTK